MLLPAWSTLSPFLPELVLVATVVAVLLIPVISPKKNSLGTGLAAALGVMIALLCLLAIDSQGQLSANPTQPLAVGGAYLNGLLIMDPFAWFYKVILLLFVLVVIALWALTTRYQMGPGDGPEFFTLLLVATLGMMLMGSTSNLLMIFLAVEMASLPSYVLAGFRKTQRLGAEAALKYVLFGAVCSSIMLYGMSLLYGQFGTLELGAIRGLVTSGTPHVVFVLGLLGLLVGVGFKVSLVPLHFWAPDVFEGTHIDIATFLSVASKGAGLALLLRVVASVIGPSGSVDAPQLAWLAHLNWLSWLLLVVGSITCFWGNLAAFAQNNIKRLLAYSSIAHAGYMLLGIAVLFALPAVQLAQSQMADGAGRGVTSVVVFPLNAQAAVALLFYLFMYLFMNAGVFVTAAAIAEKIGSENIKGYAGLGRRAPVLAMAMVVFLFALIGIPLTVGFGAKLKLLLVLFAAGTSVGYIGVVVLGMNTVVAAFYYFRVIRQMWLTQTDAPPVRELTPTGMLAAALVVPVIGLFIAYNWVDDQAQTFGRLYGQATVETAAPPPVGAAAPPALPGLAGPGLSGL